MEVSKDVLLLDPTSSVKDNEDCVEEMFAVLEQEKGLKPARSDVVTHDRFGDVFGYNDDNNDDKPTRNPKIGTVHVDVQLAREKDRELPHRVKLASQVCQGVQEELVEHSSKISTSSGELLTLFVRVLLVSDGSSGASRRYTSGVGDAKVTLAYCLLSSSGTIVLANTVYHKQDCRKLELDNYWELSNAVVHDLARKAAQHILSQIIFHIQQWQSHSQENRQRLEAIQAKLATEEDLSEDEYVFASEKHLL